MSAIKHRFGAGHLGSPTARPLTAGMVQDCHSRNQELRVKGLLQVGRRLRNSRRLAAAGLVGADLKELDHQRGAPGGGRTSCGDCC